MHRLDRSARTTPRPLLEQLVEERERPTKILLTAVEHGNLKERFEILGVAADNLAQIGDRLIDFLLRSENLRPQAERRRNTRPSFEHLIHIGERFARLIVSQIRLCTSKRTA